MIKIETNEQRAMKVIEQTDTRNIFRFVYYFDVWGNRNEGYEVNNLCHENIFIIGEPEYKDIIPFMKRIEFLKKRMHFSIPSYSDMYEIEHCSELPIGRFEELYDKKDIITKLETYTLGKTFTNNSIFYHGNMVIGIVK